jgi:hypothetical protein
VRADPLWPLLQRDKSLGFAENRTTILVIPRLVGIASEMWFCNKRDFVPRYRTVQHRPARNELLDTFYASFTYIHSFYALNCSRPVPLADTTDSIDSTDSTDSSTEEQTWRVEGAQRISPPPTSAVRNVTCADALFLPACSMLQCVYIHGLIATSTTRPYTAKNGRFVAASVSNATLDADRSYRPIMQLLITVSVSS